MSTGESSGASGGISLASGLGRGDQGGSVSISAGSSSASDSYHAYENFDSAGGGVEILSGKSENGEGGGMFLSTGSGKSGGTFGIKASHGSEGDGGSILMASGTSDLHNPGNVEIVTQANDEAGSGYIILKTESPPGVGLGDGIGGDISLESGVGGSISLGELLCKCSINLGWMLTLSFPPSCFLRPAQQSETRHPKPAAAMPRSRRGQRARKMLASILVSSFVCFAVF